MERISTRWLMILVAVLLVCTVSFSGKPTTFEYDGTGGVYLIISSDLVFDDEVDDCECKSCSWRSYKKSHKCGQNKDAGCCCASQGSPTILIKIGTYVPGVDIADTRFLIEDILANLPDDFDLGEHDGHQFTIIGSFDTDSENTIHVVTPEEDVTMPQRIQDAFYFGSPGLDVLPPEVTTAEIAVAVSDFANANAPAGHFDASGGPVLPEEILPYLFETEEELVCQSPCQAEGDLFAHEDPAELVSTYELVLQENGTVDVELCTQVGVDIQKGILNINSNEAVWVTIFGGANFDVDDIDRDSATLAGVAASESNILDKNMDGYDDLTVKFMLGDLQDADVITAVGDYTLQLKAEATDGWCIEGSDDVEVDENKGG